MLILRTFSASGMHARNVAAMTPKGGKTTSLDYGKRRARLCVDVSSRRGALARRRSRVRLHNQVGPPMFTNTTQLPVDMSYEDARVSCLFDYQQVDIAVGPHVASGYGPEENDLIRMGARDDTMNDVVQRLTAERSAIQRGLVSPYGEAAKGETRRNCARRSKLKWGGRRSNCIQALPLGRWRACMVVRGACA